MPRLAIIDENKCKPNKCSKECIQSCPPQKSGKQVIEIEDIGNTIKYQTSITNINKLFDKRQIAKIVENLCIGCNLCVKKCPFNAIKIINLPEEIPNEIIHRYSQNGFRLYKLPTIKKNMITGIIGENGVGKTTIIDILSNNVYPNFENFNIINNNSLNNKSLFDKLLVNNLSNNDLLNKDIITKFRGTSLQDYFKNLYDNKLKFSIKEQKIKKMIKNNEFLTVNEFIILNDIATNNGTYNDDDTYYKLEINCILTRKLSVLSGGELQKLLCWITSKKDADVYIFDEPSNFLDIKQRLYISHLICSLKILINMLLLLSMTCQCLTMSLMNYILFMDNQDVMELFQKD